MHVRKTEKVKKERGVKQIYERYVRKAELQSQRYTLQTQVYIAAADGSEDTAMSRKVFVLSFQTTYISGIHLKQRQ